MSSWGKTNYSTISTNVKPENRPYRHQSDEERRDVIATDRGWVQRLRYTDVHGNERVKDETLVAFSDLPETLGVPTVVEIYDEVVAANTHDVLLVFSEPVETNVTGATVALDNADGSGGANNHRLDHNLNTPDPIIGAENTLRFRGTGLGATGSYALPTAYSHHGGGEVTSLNTSLGANTMISTAVRNAHGGFTRA